MLGAHAAEYRESLRLLARDRYSMGMQLARVPELSVYSSQANFLLVKLGAGVDGTALRDHLISRHQVFIRECGNKLGMSNHFVRLVVRPQQDVARLMDGIDDYLQPSWDDELARRRDAQSA
jgi:histidinol-phosphate/aromatic aminotransferase/cobyric acid decarboxylase-like protein